MRRREKGALRTKRKLTLECELVHQVDFIGLRHIFIAKADDRDGESCRKEKNLTLADVLGQVLCEELLNDDLKFGR